MNDRQRSTLALLHRVQEFCAAYPPPSPTPAYAAKVEDLDAVILKLETHVAEQQAAEATARNATRVRRTLIVTLRDDHMVPLHRIAGTLVGTIPEVDQKFRMPSGNVDQTTVLGVARAMLKAARPLAQTFISHGQPADFVEAMEAVIGAIDRASENRFQGLRQRSGATRGLDVVLQESRRIVTYLDLIVRRAFAKDDQVLHEWQRAHQVEVRAMGSQGTIGSSGGSSSGSSTPAPSAGGGGSPSDGVNQAA